MDKKLIKKRLIDLEMTQGELADKLGISRVCMSKKMNGKTQFKMNELSAMCRILRVYAKDLINDECE